MLVVTLKHVLVGSLSPLLPQNPSILSGIDKMVTNTPLWLTIEGFKDDHQGDRRHHGGAEKAIHHYAFEHYTLWSQRFGQHGRLKKPGAFGENFSTTGMTEQTIAVGDIFKIGNAIIEVSQPRQPCWKLNIKFNDSGTAKKVQNTGMTGWYYRVIQPGYIQAGQTLTLVERRSPAWSIEKINTLVMNNRTVNKKLLSELIKLPTLSENWKKLAQNRLTLNHVEDWSDRLNDPGTNL